MNNYTGLSEGFGFIESGSMSDFMKGVIPFTGEDVTAGLENEFQTSVLGKKDNVDLPCYIENSNFLKNMIRRIGRGDASRSNYDGIMDYLNNNEKGVWENSWVRFPLNRLSPYATRVLQHDMLKDKSAPGIGNRSDVENFIFQVENRDYIRIPVSYLLKLSLADSISGGTYVHPIIKSTGESFLDSFLNDNTSPEIVSFFPVEGGCGASVSENLTKQNRKNYLLTQLLVLYANSKFNLGESGQDVSLYYSPHPPVRQKKLNEIISDSFYRELYMSPCLSGWDRGEEKHAYMELCHQVLSRSSLNSILKLKESGIVSNNRVFLKGISNISLANNGTHISIGSRHLGELLKDRKSGFTPAHEKYFGDLSIKIFEHFLPLFVGTYTASPYRLNFRDMHPELAMGFMAHELDFTHLRMMWRRWKKKAGMSIFGRPVSPTGNDGLDRYIAKLFKLKGDFIKDNRLIDYLVALLSTDESPALDGEQGNDLKLKKDLCSMGIFDRNMSVYMFYKMRVMSQAGYTGFEGRHYSLFPGLEHDMKHAINLQILITALSYKYMMNSQVMHGHIPDCPEIESERRQVIFGSAIGLPTFYVKKETKNAFLRRIIEKSGKTRISNRYKGFVRIKTDEYRKALVAVLKEDGAELIEQLGMEDTVRDLELRINDPETYSAASRVTEDICGKLGVKSPLDLYGEDFNSGTEEYYRNDLRKKHIDEGIDLFIEDMKKIRDSRRDLSPDYVEALDKVVNLERSCEFIEYQRENVKEGKVSPLHIRSLIHLLILNINHDMKNYSAIRPEIKEEIKLTV